MILFYLIGALILCHILYCVIPTCYFSLHHNDTSHLPAAEKNVFLTFDDGPNAKFTERILTLLREHGIKAAFFVVAKKAAQNEDIIQQMLKEGHVVALHSLEHKSVWIKGWRYIKSDFEKSSLILKNLGCKPLLYRPPWGHINFSSLLLAKKYGMKIMLWDVMAQDWKESSSGLLILGKLFQRTKNNSVICLHDSDDEFGCAKNAPERTIQALQVFIPVMIKAGYRFVLPEKYGDLQK